MDAPNAIAQLVNDSQCDLLVMGAHGHRRLEPDPGRYGGRRAARVKVQVLIVSQGIRALLAKRDLCARMSKQPIDVKNKRAGFEYHLLDTYECGMVLIE